MIGLDDLFDNFDTNELLEIIANIKYEEPDDKETPLIIGKTNFYVNIFPIEGHQPKATWILLF